MAKELSIEYEKMIELWNETTFESNKGILNSTHHRFLKIQELLGREPDNDIATKLAIKEENLIRNHCRLYPDTIEALTILSSKGYKLGILTNCSKSSLNIFNVTELTKYFDKIALSFQINQIKPDSESYNFIIKQLGSDFKRAVFVGDGNNNELLGAKESGLLSIKISRDHHADDRLDYDFKVNNLVDIPKVLEDNELNELEKRINSLT